MKLSITFWKLAINVENIDNLPKFIDNFWKLSKKFQKILIQKLSINFRKLSINFQKLSTNSKIIDNFKFIDNFKKLEHTSEELCMYCVVGTGRSKIGILTNEWKTCRILCDQDGDEHRCVC